jgi:hypothetical protein
MFNTIAGLYVVVAFGYMISHCIEFIQGVKGTHSKSDQLRAIMDSSDLSVKLLVLGAFTASFISSVLWIYYLPRSIIRKMRQNV